ncbi:GIY-YIG nuclease family protein [Salipiger sp. 1_MG-2023]|uniref:GIY-YIG nuclease family protein n=1 Tax=Salipiger sp. 1_MG-2023 TaxID=3062665 RepID=UPI0026E2EDCD|nr:GIY-YIG nuclease family protein [Salipiger sp. 1_MG-2023]MDO6587566.1 GIY-YIG nuclease family protein [Salipiger sp. 1_MG-2023]
MSTIPDEIFGRTIQLFLVDGKPTGLRKASIHGWTGLVFLAGDAAFGAMTKRKEVNRTGVYILAGPDPEGTKPQKVYIGSANVVAERIINSSKKHGFWDVAVAVTTSDDDLSKGHAEYLEARLIELAGKSERVALDNIALPSAEDRRLPEADRANMEQFLANLKIVLPVVGIDMLKPQPSLLTTSTPKGAMPDEPVVFEIVHKKSGITAKMTEGDGEFVVLAGSQAIRDSGYAHSTYRDLKLELVKDGTLAELDGARYTFTKPHSFKFISAAAAVVLDRNSNGRVEWKRFGTGETYADWQQAQGEPIAL